MRAGAKESHIGLRDFRRVPILASAASLAIGFAWPWLRMLNMGRLPGDIVIERPGVHIYFPIVSCLVISLVLTLLFWVFRK